jgi:hypothetical protein
VSFDYIDAVLFSTLSFVERIPGRENENIGAGKERARHLPPPPGFFKTNKI